MPHSKPARSRSYRVAACALALVAAGACGGGGERQPSAPEPVSAAALALLPGDTTVRIGGQISIAATVLDSAGMVLPGRTVTWSSSDESIARVNADGVVTGIAAGTARITAAEGTRRASIVIRVIHPVAQVAISAASRVIGTGGTTQLTATVRDASGAVVNRLVAWSSSDDQVATVSPAGIVTGMRAGSVVIRAESEGVVGAVAITVVFAELPAIIDVSPSPLAPGATVTITGAHFSANASEVHVTVDGVPATVLSAAPTQLVVRLGSYACAPTRDVPVAVTSLGGTTTVQRPLRIAPTRTLGVGEVLYLESAAESRCNELPAGTGRYLVNVVSISPASQFITPLSIRGAASGASSNRAMSSAAPTVVLPPATRGPANAIGAAGGRMPGLGGAAEHIARLDDLRKIAERFGRPGTVLRSALRAQRRASGSGAALSAAPVPLEEGAVTTLKLPNSGTCATWKDIPARVVHVGTRSVVLEATNAPLAGQMDADYERLGVEFDTLVYDVVKRNFGDPLALDGETDANGRVLMLFTPAVNDRGESLLGFVTGCDFYPPSFDPVVASSNQAEIFYARVPTLSSGEAASVESRTGWMRSMRSTVAHEVKHIASFAARIANDAEVLEEAWFEEGTAQVAAEIYGRATYPAPGAPFRGNATYRNTTRCELRPGTQGCGDVPFLMIDMFAFAFAYYRAIEQSSFFSSPSSDVNIYGSAWLFARWAADHFATTESAFFTALTQEKDRSGLGAVAALAQLSPADLQVRFLLSLYADDDPRLAPGPGSLLTIPSWNMPDMWKGFNSDIPGYFSSASPLEVHRVTAGTFEIPPVDVPGGAGVFVELSSAEATAQLVEVRSGSGAQLSSNAPIRLSILRIE